MPTVLSKESTGEFQKRRHLSAVIPLDRPVPKKLNKSDYETLKLRTDPEDNQSPTYEITLVFFSTGEPEVWLDFMKTVDKVFKGQHLTTGPARYSLYRRALRGDALAAFESAAATQGAETVAHLELVMNSVSNHVFPERAVRTQKRWMRRQLRKPHDLSIREWVARVVELNDQIPNYPHPEGEGPSEKLDDDELMDILEFGVPNSWQKQMILHDFDPVQKSTTEFIQFCERIEKTEDKPMGSKSSEKSTKKRGLNYVSRSGGQTKRGSSPESKGSKYCMLHGTNNNHSTEECRTLKHQADRMKQTYKAQHPSEKKEYKKRQELNAMVAEAVSQAMKAQKKKSSKKRKVMEDDLERENYNFDKLMKDKEDSSSSSSEDERNSSSSDSDDDSISSASQSTRSSKSRSHRK